MESLPEDTTDKTYEPLSQRVTGGVDAHNGETDVYENKPQRRANLGSAISTKTKEFLGLTTIGKSTKKQDKTVVQVPLKEFPPVVQGILSEFDVDHDGNLDASELASAAKMYKDSRKAQKRLFRLMIFMLIVIVLLCGALSGIIYAIVWMTRQTDVQDSGYMTVKGDPERPVSVSASTKFTQVDWTETVNDDILRTLHYIELSPGTLNKKKIIITITAAARETDDATGTTVTFITDLGIIYFSGTGAQPIIEIDDSKATYDIFRQLGFTVVNSAVSGRRRLADSTTTTSLFSTTTITKRPPPPPPPPPPPASTVCTGTGCSAGGGGTDIGGVGRRMLRDRK